MCDAIELVKIISAHIKSQENQLLLNYSTNRRARAIQVIELANSGMSIFVRLMNSTFIRRWIVGVYSIV
jgi:2-polyprenyl-6-methoxyphenol hydroxylase-like FAD-dependent oxidoreductase